MIRTTCATLIAIAAGTTGMTASDAIAASGVTGPDIIVGSLDGVTRYNNIGGTRAFSIGTTACNIGTEEADWVADTVRHPVISATIWKYDDETARLTQLGVTQLKHSFASLQQDACSTCTATGWNSIALQPGCSDPYGPGLNGDQTGLGPRSEVNPFTAEFQYPFTGINNTGNSIYKRLQVQQSDIEDSTATFFAEGQYVLKDDYENNTHFNNVSYREYNINQSTFTMSGVGPTFREIPAIYAWQAMDPSVEITETTVPGEGRIIVASKVTDLGNGMYRYDYGVYNQNSDKAISSVSIPKNTATQGLFFNDVSYHSDVDENISGADWAVVDDDSAISWSTQKESANQWANAIRWGTMYNFCFETDMPPTDGAMTLGLFKSGADIAVNVPVPQQAVTTCAVDFDGSGSLDFGDVSEFLSLFASQKPAADLDGSGGYDFSDVSTFLSLYAAGCP